MKTARAKKIIDRLGIVLVYPIANRPEPPSLWSELFPKTKMDWSWDSYADDRVGEVWRLRERLAASGEVAYAKWFQGRATFFSLPVFHALLASLSSAGDPFRGLPAESMAILELLRERSPQSTKEVRAEAGLKGREHERVFTQAMKALWARLLVVGTGEIPDGAFPSLAVASTELVFEDIWTARAKPPKAGKDLLNEVLERSKPFDREFSKSWRAIHDAENAAKAKVGSSGATRRAKRAVVAKSDYDEKERGPGISMRDALDDEDER